MNTSTMTAPDIGNKAAKASERERKARAAYRSGPQWEAEQKFFDDYRAGSARAGIHTSVCGKWFLLALAACCLVSLTPGRAHVLYLVGLSGIGLWWLHGQVAADLARGTWVDGKLLVDLGQSELFARWLGRCLGATTLAIVLPWREPLTLAVLPILVGLGCLNLHLRQQRQHAEGK